jgi:hypothetical protein
MNVNYTINTKNNLKPFLVFSIRTRRSYLMKNPGGKTRGTVPLNVSYKTIAEL